MSGPDWNEHARIMDTTTRILLEQIGRRSSRRTLTLLPLVRPFRLAMAHRQTLGGPISQNLGLLVKRFW